MFKRSNLALVSCALAAALLPGCGGGAGGSASVSPSAPGVTQQTAQVQLSFTFGGTGASSHARHLDYISRATNGIGIRVRANAGGTFSGTNTAPLPIAADVSATSASCIAGSNGARTCTVSVPAPVGYDDFEVTAWDSTPVSGSFAAAKKLSQSIIANQLVIANVNNPFTFTMDGVVDSIYLSLNPNTLVSGTATVATLSVIAKDSSGNIIVAPANYVDATGAPLTITVGATPACTLGAPVCSTPGTTVLGTTSFTGPAVTTSTVTYNGGPLTGSTFVATPSLAIAGSNISASLNFTNTNGGIGIPGTPTIAELAPTTSSSQNSGIALGPDGNIWFCEQTANKIGVLTPGGVFTEYSIPTATAGASAITLGSDGAMWFAEQSANKIGRVTVAGSFTEYSAGLSASASLRGITLGSDNNVWFTEFGTNKVGRITPAGTITEYATPGAAPLQIASGGDGNIWFSELGAGKIATLTVPGGVFTEYAVPSAAPFGITAGPDGNLWFTELTGTKVGKITTGGVLTEYNVGVQATDIAGGPDGNLWFTTNSAGSLGRITTAGSSLTFTNGISASAQPYGIATGSDKNIYFTEFNAPGKIGKATP